MSTTDNTNAALRGSESNDQLGPLPEPALTHDRHGHMLLIGPCYTSNQMRAYAAQERAAERERCGQVYGSREVAMSDEIRRLAREAHTWSKAAETYATQLERHKLACSGCATGWTVYVSQAPNARLTAPDTAQQEQR